MLIFAFLEEVHSGEFYYYIQVAYIYILLSFIWEVIRKVSRYLVIKYKSRWT